MRGIPAATIAAFLLGSAVSGAPIRAILIDGAATQKQTPVIKTILESTGLFEVDVVTTPAKDASSTNFQTQFDRYKVVVLNYSGDTWPVASMSALDKYLDGGGGLVVLPSSDSAFPAWPEYNRMIGISSGANRAESAGPVWFYKAGNIAYDTSTLGPAGKVAHPGQPVPITTRYTEHPITKGLPLVWMHSTDAIAGNLRGPGANMTVLATAKVDPEKGGTGRDELQLVTVMYGKGRVFHTELGRSPDGMACAGFQVTLQRGAEWAATGKVTQKLPADFPTEDKSSVRTTPPPAK